MIREHIREAVFWQLYICKAHKLSKSRNWCFSFSAHNGFTYRLQPKTQSSAGKLALNKVAAQATTNQFGLIKTKKYFKNCTHKNLPKTQR